MLHSHSPTQESPVVVSNGPSSGWPLLICDHHAGLFSDQHRRTIIGMTAQPFGLVLQPIKRRPEVCVKAIMADDQLVELSAGADVLVFEHRRPGDVGLADEIATKYSINSAASTFVPGKKLEIIAKPWIDLRSMSMARDSAATGPHCHGEDLRAHRAPPVP